MRIGIYTPYLDTLTGGEKYMLSIASCLSQKNDVSLFWDNNREQIRTQAEKKLGINLSAVSFVNNIFTNKTSLIKRLLQTRDYDVIIFLSDGSIPLISCRLILHFQFPVEWVSVKSFVTRLKLQRVNKIICNSNYTKIFIDKKFNISSTVLYPPISIQKGIFPKENIILNVGRFGKNAEGAYYKKQDILINTFKAMTKRKLGDWRFVLVISILDRDKNNLEELKEKAENLPVDFVVNPSYERLWELYRKAKIYWHASGFGEDLVRHPERAEHFGISTVEAMGSGAVPVVIDAGGQKEIVEDTVSGYLWRSEDDLIKKTEILIRDNVLWEKLQKGAIKRSKIFTGDRFCKEINSIVDEK